MGKSTFADRLGMVLKLALPTFILTLPFALVIGAPVLFTLVVVVVAIGGMMLFASLCVKGCAWLLYHDDPEYQGWRAQGGHPYWDLVPWPFNNKSELDRQDEPSPLSQVLCPGCHQPVVETVPGSLYGAGMTCPHCFKAMKYCPYCHALIGEATAGDFAQPIGVRCWNCHGVVQPDQPPRR